jgi:ERCC4-related helicase
MIISDIKAGIDTGRTPVILTRYKEQAKYLYENLSGSADYVFILYGDNSDKENSEVRKALREVPGDKSMILVATGQKIGEGFDFPRLDTLMLAAPVSFGGRLEQYVGRLHRDYDGNLVWHGGMNLLGKEDAWDNLMRIKSAQVAEELLELWFQVYPNSLSVLLVTIAAPRICPSHSPPF